MRNLHTRTYLFTAQNVTSLVVEWSESMTNNHEVPGSIPGSTVGIFLEGEDSRGDHGLGRLVEFRFKSRPGTTSPSITTHTPSGQRNCASWASQPQKSITILSCPGGRATKSTKDMWWHWGGGHLGVLYFTYTSACKGENWCIFRLWVVTGLSSCLTIEFRIPPELGVGSRLQDGRARIRIPAGARSFPPKRPD